MLLPNVRSYEWLHGCQQDKHWNKSISLFMCCLALFAVRSQVCVISKKLILTNSNGWMWFMKHRQLQDLSVLPQKSILTFCLIIVALLVWSLYGHSCQFLCSHSFLIVSLCVVIVVFLSSVCVWSYLSRQKSVLSLLSCHQSLCSHGCHLAISLSCLLIVSICVVLLWIVSFLLIVILCIGS